MQVVIEGTLPGMNDVISRNRNTWQSGAALKKRSTDWCYAFFFNALRTGAIKPVTKQVDIHVKWYEKNRRRDHDNVLAGGLKMILDGAVKAGVLPDDSQKWVADIHSEIDVDRNRPRVEIEFNERE